MTTITITTPLLSEDTSMDSAQAEIREPIADLLIQIGKILLKDELNTERLSIGKVARIAQKYKLRWPGFTHKAKALEEMILHYFDHHDYIKAEGVMVKWRTEREGGRQQLQLSFHRYVPANARSQSLNPAESESHESIQTH